MKISNLLIMMEHLGLMAPDGRVTQSGNQILDRVDQEAPESGIPGSFFAALSRIPKGSRIQDTFFEDRRIQRAIDLIEEGDDEATALLHAAFRISGGVGAGFNPPGRRSFHGASLIKAFKNFMREAEDSALFPARDGRSFVDYLAKSEDWRDPESGAYHRMVMLLAREYMAFRAAEEPLLRNYQDLLQWQSGKPRPAALMLSRGEIEREVLEIVCEETGLDNQGVQESLFEDIPRFIVAKRLEILFGVSLRKSEVRDWKAIDDVVLAIHKKLFLAERIRDDNPNSLAGFIRSISQAALEMATIHRTRGEKIFLLKMDNQAKHPRPAAVFGIHLINSYVRAISAFNTYQIMPNTDGLFFEVGVAEYFAKNRTPLSPRAQHYDKLAQEVGRKIFVPLGPDFLELLRERRDYLAGLLNKGPLAASRLWKAEEVVAAMKRNLEIMIGEQLRRDVLLNGEELVLIPHRFLERLAQVWMGRFEVSIDFQTIGGWRSFNDMAQTVLGLLDNPQPFQSNYPLYRYFEFQHRCLTTAVDILEKRAMARPSVNSSALSPPVGSEIIGSLAVADKPSLIDESRPTDHQTPLFNIVGISESASPENIGFRIVGATETPPSPALSGVEGSVDNTQAGLQAFCVAGASSLGRSSVLMSNFGFKVIR